MANRVSPPYSPRGDKHDRLHELKIDRADIESTRSGGGLALVVITLLLVVIGGGVWFFYAQSRIPTVKTVPVEAEDPGAVASAATVLDASGYVTARRRATVSSKITGKIVEVMIEEGMAVEEGQILARLDDATQTRQLALAEAELGAAHGRVAETEVRIAEARLNQKRIERLVEANVSTEQDLDAIRAEVDSLEARLAVSRQEIEVAERRLALRRQDLDDTVIRAPFTGVVVTKNAQPGEMISPVSAGGGFTRTGIGTVVDMSSLEIEVDVNEAYIKRVEPGQEVQAMLDAYPDWQIPCRVITSVPTADRQKATVQVRIGFDLVPSGGSRGANTVDARILPDMGVRVSFLEAEPEEPPPTASSAPRWRVPEAALRLDGEQDIVFVLKNGRLERRAVSVGSRRDGVAVILAGVSAGEEVVVEGPEELQDGDPATPASATNE